MSRKLMISTVNALLISTKTATKLEKKFINGKFLKYHRDSVYWHFVIEQRSLT